MIKMKFTLLWLFTLLVSLTSVAQSNLLGDPAVTSAQLRPGPPPIPGGVGAPFAMTFTIGNSPAGLGTITGANGANKMSFGICLGKSNPATGVGNALASLSGPLLEYFDVVYRPGEGTGQGGCFEGIQKNVALPPGAVYDIVINAVVTTASSSTAVNDIGASCNIGPSPTANPQDQSNDALSIYTRTTVALPVSLVSFTAQAQTDRTVLVNWTTSWERANKGYVVERSKDLKNFERAGEVTDVAGSSNSVNSYRFVDASPFRGTSYYRLRQVDLDGTSQTFKAESVVIDGRYGVYPNPVANQQFTLELDEPATAVLHLYNASGSELGLNKSDLTELSTKVTPSSKLSSGVYILKVDERGTTRKHRLVVQ